MTAQPTAADIKPDALQPELRDYMKRCRDSKNWDEKFTASADRFIARAKAGGWWERLSAVYFLCAPTREAALLNVKDPGLTLTAHGKINFAPHEGMQGDGKTGYLDVGAPPAKIPGWSLDAHSVFIYSQTDNPGLSGDVGSLGAGANLGVRARNGVQLAIWSTTSTQVQVNIKSGIGFSGFVRTGEAGGFVIKDAELHDFLQKSVTLPTGNMSILRVSRSKYLSKNQLAFVFFGDGKITKEQALDMREACVAMLGASGLGTQAIDEAPEAAKPPHAFTRDSIKAVTPAGLRVFRGAPPPKDDRQDFAASYPYAPITDAYIRPWGPAALAKDTTLARWELIWSDRGFGPTETERTGWAKKPNDTMGGVRNSAGVNCRTEFTTYDKAIGSTLVKTAYSAGLKFRADPDHPDRKGWGDIAEEWGYDVSAWQARWAANPDDPVFTQDLDIDTGDIVHRKFCTAPENLDTFFKHEAVTGVFKTSRDRVILGPGRLADIAMREGFLLDHEHADSRPPELQMRYIAELRKIAHCKNLKLGASGHRVNGGPGAHCGWTPENANELLHLFDWFTLIADATFSGERLRAELQAQYDFLRGPARDKPVPGDKLCMQIHIGAPGQEMRLDDVHIAREFMIAKKIPRCSIIPVYADLGGPLSRQPNQVIATFLGLPVK